MRRRWKPTAVFGFALLALMVLPAVASASSSYKVKDMGGHLHGTVEYTSRFEATVKRSSGAVAGYVVSQDSGAGWHYTVSNSPIGTGGQDLARIIDHGVYRANFSGPFLPNNGLGKVVKVDSRWVVKKKVNGKFHSVGRVSGACRRGFAIGAGWLLLW